MNPLQKTYEITDSQDYILLSPTPLHFMYRTIQIVSKELCSVKTKTSIKSTSNLELMKRVERCIKQEALPKIANSQCCDDVAENIFTVLSGNKNKTDRDVFFPDEYFLEEINSKIFKYGDYVFLIELQISNENYDICTHSFIIEKIGDKFRLHQSFANNYCYSESFKIYETKELLKTTKASQYISKEQMQSFIIELDILLKKIDIKDSIGIEKKSREIFIVSLLPTLEKYPGYGQPYLLIREAIIAPKCST